MNSIVFRELIRSKGSIILSRVMMKTFGLELSVFIADLADRDEYFSRNNPQYDGWFFSTKESRSNETGVSERTLTRLMGIAKANGLLASELRGIPPKEWIRLDYEEIYRQIEEVVMNSIGTQTRKDYPTQRSTVNGTQTREDINHTNITIQTKKPSVEGAGSQDHRYMVFAQQLDKMLQSIGKKPQSSTTLLSWCKYFRQLHKLDDTPLSELRAVLEWYSRNIGKPYVSQAFSGKTFRDKYLNIKLQMENSGKSSRRTGPRPEVTETYEDIKVHKIDNRR